MNRLRYVSLIGITLAAFCSTAGADVDQLLQAITKIGHKGKGHAEATSAAQKLAQADADALIPILEAMDEANPLAVNWLRGAFEAIAARTLASQSLPVKELEKFLADTSHAARARRLAYEWIIQANPDAAERIIPGMLADPSPEMRRDAVLRLINQAKQAAQEGQKNMAVKLYRKALTGASEAEQVEPIVKALTELGETVDRVKHYGLLTEWYVIGPFDNRDEKGFPVVYPPEEHVDLQATYEGQQGPVQWQKLKTQDEQGVFDLAELTKPHKGAIDYLTTVVISDRDRPVEFRLATANAWKLWVNGELVFAREEYHRGMQFDQYRVPGRLAKGPNRILIKICQNEQEQPWAQRWSLQFRICDPSGLSADVQVADKPTATGSSNSE